VSLQCTVVTKSFTPGNGPAFGLSSVIFTFFGSRGRRHSLGGELETLVERCEEDEMEVIHLETEAAHLGLCKDLGNYRKTP
jgi:hypothetical protein